VTPVYRPGRLYGHGGSLEQIPDESTSSHTYLHDWNSSGSVTMANIGSKVRLKSGSPLMTVTRKTAEGYLVCEWFEPRGGVRHESMFFPELVMAEEEEEEEEEAPPEKSKD
jgi:uncharacterized protein YodC (DUF2158 family)